MELNQSGIDQDKELTSRHRSIDPDDYELQDLEEYVLIETRRIENFKRMIIHWINSFSDVIQEPLNREIEFRDSVMLAPKCVGGVGGRRVPSPVREGRGPAVLWLQRPRRKLH